MIVELTNMCLVYQNDKILFLNRKRSTWPGITLPGGHVENNETITESVIREIKEETGLELEDIKFVDYIEWNSAAKKEISFLFKCNSFKGELKSSFEGEVFFARLDEIDPNDYSDGFSDILKKYRLV